MTAGGLRVSYGMRRQVSSGLQHIDQLIQHWQIRASIGLAHADGNPVTTA
jgi:hypothetical protein